MAKKIIGKSSSSKWRETRRSILAELIGDSPDLQWSYRDMAQAMREHDLVGRHQPSYSHSTAQRDWLAIRDELKEKRHELASAYIDSQLEITEDILADLIQDYNRISELDLNEVDDPEIKAAIAISLIKSKKELVLSIDRLLARQQTIIPVAVPKQINIDERRLTINADKFMQLRAEAMKRNQLAQSEIIEGELIDN